MSSGSVCLLAAVSPGRERELEAKLGNIPTGDESPFARLGSTHFARFQIVPYLKDSAGDQLDATTYLLFAAEFDGPAEEYIDALCGEASLLPVWEECARSGESGLRKFLEEHRIDPGYSVLGYPGATVAEIRDALELEDRLIEFGIEARGLEPGQLRARWLERFTAGG